MAFDFKVGLLVKRLVKLVTKKMHKDYLVDYKCSNHINTIYSLPKELL